MNLIWHMKASFSFKCPRCGSFLPEGNPLDDCPVHRVGTEKPKYDPMYDGVPDNLASVLYYLARHVPTKIINEYFSLNKGNSNGRKK